MQTVRQIAREILAREGGFVNDPDDPGGATNHGVTIGTMRRLGLDLDKDGAVTIDDLRALRKDDAVKIFLEHYYRGPGIGKLPAPLRASVFDMQVNAGSQAIRILQNLLNDMGFPLDVDGAIGAQTAQAAHRAMRAAPRHLVDAYGIARRNYYYALGDARPVLRKFARRQDGGKGGWITRAEAFIVPAYHLSRAQHDERVAQWD